MTDPDQGRTSEASAPTGDRGFPIFRLPDYEITFHAPITAAQLAGIKAAFEATGAMARKAMLQIGQNLGLIFGFTEVLGQHELAARRREYGGNGEDAFEYPDEWLSTVCGAWLCQAGATCPSEEHDLQCSHSCHRRKRR